MVFSKKKRKRKISQISLEYVIIFGISFSIILMLFSFVIGDLRQGESGINKDKITKIGNDMINYIEKVYYLGKGNKLTYQVIFPSGINQMYIWFKNNISILVVNFSLGNSNSLSYFYPSDSYVKFNFSSKNSAYFNSSQNKTYLINGSYYWSQGMKEIQFISKGDWVEVFFYIGNQTLS